MVETTERPCLEEIQVPKGRRYHVGNVQIIQEK